MDTKVKEQQKDLIKQELIRTFYSDFGKPTNTVFFDSWPDLSWEEFREEMHNNNINPNSCAERDWEEYFIIQKKKYQDL